MKGTLTHLYLINGATDDGDSLDWIVEASSADEAARLYMEMLDDLDVIPGDGTRIYRLPAVTGKARTLSWYTEVKDASTTVTDELLGTNQS